MILLFLLLLSPDDYEQTPAFNGSNAPIALWEEERLSDGLHVLKIEIDENGVWQSESYIDNIRKKNVRKLTGQIEEEAFERFSDELEKELGKLSFSYTGAQPGGSKYFLWINAFEKGVQYLGNDRDGPSEMAKTIRTKIEEQTVVACEQELASKWEVAWQHAKAGKSVAYKLKEVNLDKGDIDIFFIDNDSEYLIASAINDNSNKYLNLGKVLSKLEQPPSDKARIEVRQKFRLDIGEIVLPTGSSFGNR